MSKLTIKALADFELDVLGVPWGGPENGKDSQGEYFSAATDLHEDKYPLPPIVYYHGLGPDGRPAGRPEYIGKAVSRERREDGVWYRVVLDAGKVLARRVWDAARKGLARASSGSAPQLVRTDRDGHIREWPVIELSLLDIDPDAGRVPINAYAVVLPAIKAMYSQAGITLPTTLQGDSDVDENQVQERIDAAVRTAVEAAIKAQAEQRQAEQSAAEQRQTEIDAAVKAAKEAWETEAAKARRLPDGGAVVGGAPHVRRFADVDRYDGLSLEDQTFLIGIVNSKVGQRASEAAYKAAYIKAAEAKDSDSAHKMRAAAKAVGFDLSEATNAIKANELMTSTQVGYGDEWVGVGYSNQLWLAVRSPSTIAAMLPEIVIPAGAEGIYDPLEGSDPTFYKVPETTDTDSASGRPNASIPGSKAGTNRVLHTATKVGGRTIYSGEMDENSLIAVAGQLRKQLETAGQEALEHVIIDGDSATAATTNINDIANAGTQGATVLFTSFDGFRKLALVTNTANSRDCGATLDDTDFLETARLMGVAGLLGADVMKALFLIDANTRWRILTIAAVKTRDVFLNATIENGELTGIYGYKVRTSYQMHRASAKRMANTAGKIHGTDTNNTTGAILCVRPDQWKLARKRRVTFETTRYANADATEIVVTMSAGLKARDNESTAITYNVPLS
jgi:hypothetical protein